MNLTCTHAAAGLCPACRAEYDLDSMAYREFGAHQAGLENLRRLQAVIDAVAQLPKPGGAVKKRRR